MTNYLRSRNHLRAHCRKLADQGISFRWLGPNCVEVSPTFAPTYYIRVINS